ncbi:MAG: nucleotidyltransferase domain-containing protein [Chloroflexia bacterium]|nr:nucleotidyltransferase domain-containing protein [Chloroflexia bacterium]
MGEPSIELLPTIAGVRVRTLLAGVRAWAAERPDVVAVALAGSWARGDARPESDVDLLLVVRDVAGYLAFPAWLAAFGEPGDTAREAVGAAPSLRVWYADGPEVEFVVTTPAWCETEPVDPGTADVVRDGLVAVYDPDGVLARLIVTIGGH